MSHLYLFSMLRNYVLRNFKVSPSLQHEHPYIWGVQWLWEFRWRYGNDTCIQIHSLPLGKQCKDTHQLTHWRAGNYWMRRWVILLILNYLLLHWTVYPLILFTDLSLTPANTELLYSFFLFHLQYSSISAGMHSTQKIMFMSNCFWCLLETMTKFVIHSRMAQNTPLSLRSSFKGIDGTCSNLINLSKRELYRVNGVSTG